MKRLIITVFILSMVGCPMYDTTYEEAIAPIIAEYGQPEEVTEYETSDYHIIKLWYWTQGICITVQDMDNDNHFGYNVSSYYYFTPID